jgi:LacI family transcriptional regulator
LFVFDYHFFTFDKILLQKPMKRTKKVTIRDVARYANVSVGTIDRVIHNRGRVSPEKRKKVEEAIEKLNFNPNMLARTLALGNQFTICALIPSAPYPGHYWTMPLNGLEIAAAQFKDYGIITEYFFYDLFDEKSFTKQAGKIAGLEPNGVILAPLFLKESNVFAEKLRQKNIPYIFIDADIPDGQSLSYIGPDVKQSAYIAGRLLNSELPDKAEILMVNMVKGFENASALRRMEEGFKNYFSGNGQKENKTIHTLTIQSTKKEEVFRELTKFYIKYPAIKGVFVTNSKAFLIAEFHHLHDMNIRLVGYDLVPDNMEHMKNGGIDFIISQSPVQQGKRAVQTLFDYFVWKKEPVKIQHVPLDIIIRENLDFYINFNRHVQNGINNNQ